MLTLNETPTTRSSRSSGPRPRRAVTSKQELLGHRAPGRITGYDGDRLGRSIWWAAADFKADGTVSGSDGCNGIGGTYTLSASGELSVRAQTSTLVGCVLGPPPAREALQAARSATITDGLLTLLDAEGAELAVFSLDADWNPYEASLIDPMRSVGVRDAGSEEHGFGYNLFVPLAPEMTAGLWCTPGRSPRPPRVLGPIRRRGRSFLRGPRGRLSGHRPTSNDWGGRRAVPVLGPRLRHRQLPVQRGPQRVQPLGG